MTAIDINRARPAVHRRRRHPLRILAVVDGTERTSSVVDHVIATAEGRDAIEVLVLNVQEKREDGRLRGYQSFKRSEVDDRLINDFGIPIVKSVRERLDQAGIHNVTRVQIGDPLTSIVSCAKDEGCDLIVVGDAKPNVWQRWFVKTFGISLGASVAARLAMLAPIPVAVVK